VRDYLTKNGKEPKKRGHLNHPKKRKSSREAEEKLSILAVGKPVKNDTG